MVSGDNPTEVLDQKCWGGGGGGMGHLGGGPGTIFQVLCPVPIFWHYEVPFIDNPNRTFGRNNLG